MIILPCSPVIYSMLLITFIEVLGYRGIHGGLFRGQMTAAFRIGI